MERISTLFAPVLYVLICAAAPVAADPPPRPTSVCELFDHLDEFAEQQVIVEAEYVDFYHGKALIDRACPDASVYLWIENPIYEHADVKAFLSAWGNRPTFQEIAAQFTGSIVAHTHTGFKGEVTNLFFDLHSVARWKYLPQQPIPHHR